MGAVSKLVSVVSRMLDALFCIVCTYFYGTKAVSHIDNPLLLQSATSLAKKLRHGEVSSSEVVNAYIDRIREVNADINAVVDEMFTEALREAEQVDAELSRLRSGDEGTANRELDALYAAKPFYGVPTSIKSTFAVRGASWHASLQSRLHLRAEYDANEVARLRAAGFIVLCTTSVPEMAMWIETVSTIRSRTLNPFNTSRCVGGSSGGEAALVAAGGAPVGLGSDLGGSIRIPSLFCGVFGHKTTSDTTTHHTDPVEITQSGQRREGHYPFSPSNRQLRMLSYGPICRYAEDLWPTLMSLLSKADRDRLSVNGSRTPSSVNLSRTKFLYLRSFCEDVKDGPTASTYFINQPDRLVSEAMDRVIEFVRTDLHADIEPLRFVGDEFASLRLSEGIDIFLSYIYLPDKIDADENMKSKLASCQSNAEKKQALQATWRTFDGKSWLDYATVLASHSNCQAASRVSASVELLKKLFFWPLNLLGIDHPFVSRITTPILFSAINEKGLLARSHEWQAARLHRGEVLERAFQQLFAAHKSAGYENVIIICPVMPVVAPYHGKPVICSPFDVLYAGLFNILGLPCTVAPILKDSSTRTNLPAAVQIVSDKFDDVACIAFAELLERSFGGWRQPSEAS